MRALVLAGAITTLAGGTAHAQASCDPRSFFDTATSQSLEIQNLALAYNVSEGRWNNVKSTGGVGAKIYGVPISASFDSFRSSVQQRAVSLGYSNFAYQSTSIATTSLGPNLEAYKICMGLGSPLFIVNEGGPSSAYKLSIRYNPAIGTSPVRGSVLSSNNIADSDIQSLADRLASLTPGPFLENPVIRPADPTKEATLTLGTPYHSASIVLAPLTPVRNDPDRTDIVIAPPVLDIQRVHGGADVQVVINNSACQTFSWGSISCGGLYAGRRSTAINEWYFGGPNAIRRRWTDGRYTNADNAPGNLSLWGITLTYDGTGTVFRDGQPVGTMGLAR